MHKVWGNRVSGAYAMYCIFFYVISDAFAYLMVTLHDRLFEFKAEIYV